MHNRAVSSTKAAILRLVSNWVMHEMMLASEPKCLYTFISASHTDPHRAGESHAPCPTPHIGAE
jgi:hypothetical protein